MAEYQPPKRQTDLFPRDRHESNREQDPLSDRCHRRHGSRHADDRPSGDRRVGHEAAVTARGERGSRGVRLCRRPVDRRPRRLRSATADLPRRDGDRSPLLTRRLARRVQRRVRRQRRRLRHARRRRRAEAAHLAPGRRSGPGLHRRRFGRAVRFPAQHVHEPPLPALHRAADRRVAREAADPARAARQLLVRRPPYRLHPDAGALPAVEELPRRHDVPHLDLRHRGPLGADDPPTRGPLERHESDLDRQPGLLPFRPGRRVQPLLLRHGQRRDRPALRVRGLPRRGPLGFHGHGDLRAGGLPAPLRAGLGPP